MSENVSPRKFLDRFTVMDLNSFYHSLFHFIYMIYTYVLYIYEYINFYQVSK